MDRLAEEILPIRDRDTALDFRDNLERMLTESDGPIFIVPHMSIDDDAVGSSVGCAHFLGQTFPGREVIIIFPDPGDTARSEQFKSSTDGYKVLWENGDFAQYIPEKSTLIMLDNMEWRRSGISDTQLKALDDRDVKRIIIDHHSDEPDSNTISYIDEHASSASEIIARMYADRPMSPNIARLLLYGIAADTGLFRFVKYRRRARKVINTLEKITGLTDARVIRELLGEIPGDKQKEGDPAEKQFVLTGSGMSEAESGDGNDDGEVSVVSEAVAEVQSGAAKQYIRDLKNETRILNVRSKEGVTDRVAFCMRSSVSPLSDDVDEKKLSEDYLDSLLSRADFAVYMKPVRINADKASQMRKEGYEAEDGDIIWELKMRTNTVRIAGKVGRGMHRGGSDGAGKGEFWPGPALREIWQTGNFTLADMARSVRREFVRVFRQVRAG